MCNVTDELFHLLIILEVGVVGLAGIGAAVRRIGDAVRGCQAKYFNSSLKVIGKLRHGAGLLYNYIRNNR